MRCLAKNIKSKVVTSTEVLALQNTQKNKKLSYRKQIERYWRDGSTAKINMHTTTYVIGRRSGVSSRPIAWCSSVWRTFSYLYDALNTQAERSVSLKLGGTEITRRHRKMLPLGYSGYDFLLVGCDNFISIRYGLQIWPCFIHKWNVSNVQGHSRSSILAPLVATLEQYKYITAA